MHGRPFGLAVLVAAVLGAVPFQVVSFAVALFGAALATVCLVLLRGAVVRFEEKVAEIEAKLPTPPPDR